MIKSVKPKTATYVEDEPATDSELAEITGTLGSVSSNCPVA